jgi:hypothetical protein
VQDIADVLSVEARRQTLALFWQTDFPLVFKLAERLVWYETWGNVLTRKTAEIQRQDDTSSSVAKAGQVQNLLYIQKRAKFRVFFGSGNSEGLLVRYLEDFAQNKRGLDKDAMIADMRKRLLALKDEVLTKETALRTYTTSVAALAGFLRLFTGNVFYQMGREGFLLADEVSNLPAFESMPVVNHQLTPGYKQFFSNVTGTALLAMDLQSHRRTGTSYFFASSVGQWLVSNVNVLTDVFGDEARAARAIPQIDWTLGLGIVSCFSFVRSRFNVAVLPVTAAVYCLATGVRNLCGWGVEKHVDHRIKQERSLKTLESTARSVILEKTRPILSTAARFFGHYLGARLGRFFVFN